MPPQRWENSQLPTPPKKNIFCVETGLRGSPLLHMEYSVYTEQQKQGNTSSSKCYFGTENGWGEAEALSPHVPVFQCLKKKKNIPAAAVWLWGA